MLSLLLGVDSVEGSHGGSGAGTLALRHRASGFAFELSPAGPGEDGAPADPGAVDFDPVDFGALGATLPADFRDCVELSAADVPAFWNALHSHMLPR